MIFKKENLVQLFFHWNCCEIVSFLFWAIIAMLIAIVERSRYLAILHKFIFVLPLGPCILQFHPKNWVGIKSEGGL